MRFKVIVTLLLMFFSSIACANNWWQNMWLRPDQQAANQLKQGHAENAAKLFANRHWRAVAHYRAGQYQQSLADVNNPQTALDYYNRGNTLAHLGRYQAAIAAYQQSLSLQKDYPDAEHNIEVIRKLMKNKKQQKQNQNQQHNQQQKNQQQHNNNQQRNKSGKDKSNKDKQTKNNKHSQNQQQNKESQQNQHQSQNQTQNKDSKNKKQSHGQNQKQQQGKPNQHAKQQAKWLDQIPDDPGGLLRQKFFT